MLREDGSWSASGRVLVPLSSAMPTELGESRGHGSHARLAEGSPFWLTAPMALPTSHAVRVLRPNCALRPSLVECAPRRNRACASALSIACLQQRATYIDPPVTNLSRPPAGRSRSGTRRRQRERGGGCHALPTPLRGAPCCVPPRRCAAERGVVGAKIEEHHPSKRGRVEGGLLSPLREQGGHLRHIVEAWLVRCKSILRPGEYPDTPSRS